MGKRELLLIVAFVIAGVVVHRLTAPPPPPGAGGFSLRRLFEEIRADVQGSTYKVDRELTTRATVPEGVARLVVEDLRGLLVVRGAEGTTHAEVRARLAVYGIDEADARRRAAQASLALERRADALELVMDHSASMDRAEVELTLVVPAHLTLEAGMSGGRLQVESLAGVRLDVRRVDGLLTGVGTIEGTQRDGRLHVAGAGTLAIETRGTDTTVERIAEQATITTRDGRLEALDLDGSLHVSAQRTRIEARGLRGPIEVTCTDDRITLRDVRAPLRLEGRRAELIVELAEISATSVSTTDEPLEIRLPADVPVRLDVRVERGRLRLPGDLAPEVADGVQQWRGELGGPGGPTVTLRNEEAPIIVDRAAPSTRSPLARRARPARAALTPSRPFD